MQSVAPVGDDRAYLEFVLGLKQYFAGEVYPRLRQQYDARVAESGTPTPADARAAGTEVGELPTEPRSAGAIVEDLPAYPLFQWLERNTQKMMWRPLGALIPPPAAGVDAPRESTPAEPIGSPESAPNLPFPNSYTPAEF